VVEKCILYVMNQHSPSSKKEVGRFAKNAILKEIQKILKNPFAVPDSIISFSKQFLTQIRHEIELKIYHKSSCITCKKTITELERMKADIEKRDFFKEPFSEIELEKIIKATGKKPAEMLRKRDKMYKELDLEKAKKSDAQIIKLMVKYPGLILRPIIVTKNKTLSGKVDVKNLK